MKRRLRAPFLLAGLFSTRDDALGKPGARANGNRRRVAVSGGADCGDGDFRSTQRSWLSESIISLVLNKPSDCLGSFVVDEPAEGLQQRRIGRLAREFARDAAR